MSDSRFKKFIDVLLLLLFFAGLGGMFLPHRVHIAAGCVFLAAVVLHNVANKNFYRAIFRGQYTLQRIINVGCVFLFAVALVVLAVSGALLAFAAAGGADVLSLHLAAATAALVLLFVHIVMHARRYVRGKIFYAAAVFAFVFAAAGIFGLPYLDRWYHVVEVSPTQIVRGEKFSTAQKTLVVYFSRVGNTDFPQDVDAVSGASVMRDKATGEIFGNAEMIALMAQDATGGDIAAIRTEKIYPADYGETTKIAKAEFASDNLPALKTPVPDVSSYDTVVLVYPLWWGTLPMPAASFLANCNLAGKTVVPIVTHGGSGSGESLAAIKNYTAAHVAEPLAIYSSDVTSAREKITEFLQKVFRDK